MEQGHSNYLVVVLQEGNPFVGLTKHEFVVDTNNGIADRQKQRSGTDVSIKLIQVKYAESVGDCFDLGSGGV